MQKLLHVLELKAGDQDEVLVKEYVRAGAGHLTPDVSDLRPPDVLLDTMHYLIMRSVMPF